MFIIKKPQAMHVASFLMEGRWNVNFSKVERKFMEVTNKKISEW